MAPEQLRDWIEKKREEFNSPYKFALDRMVHDFCDELDTILSQPEPRQPKNWRMVLQRIIENRHEGDKVLIIAEDALNTAQPEPQDTELRERWARMYCHAIFTNDPDGCPYKQYVTLPTEEFDAFNHAMANIEVRPELKEFKERLGVQQEIARAQAPQPTEHIFDPDSCLQDCSCGWKTTDERRHTIESAHAAWEEHIPAQPPSGGAS